MLSRAHILVCWTTFAKGKLTMRGVLSAFGGLSSRFLEELIVLNCPNTEFCCHIGNSSLNHCPTNHIGQSSCPFHCLGRLTDRGGRGLFDRHCEHD